MHICVGLAFAAVLAATAAAPACAQHQWRDADGRMNFSDLPPPAFTPPANVLRMPRTAAAAQPPSGPAPAPDGATVVPSGVALGAGRPAGTPASLADRELEFRKRRLERAEAERKDADRRAQTQRLARLCDEARGSLRALDSGLRITQVSATGEREVLDDEAREQRVAAIRRDLQEQCGPVAGR